MPIFNFSLKILEICSNDLNICAEIEQKWINKLKPEYNVLKIARSSLGLKHSIETINKLKEQFKKENHPKYGTKASVETKEAISSGIKEFYKKKDLIDIDKAFEKKLNLLPIIHFEIRFFFIFVNFL